MIGLMGAAFLFGIVVGCSTLTRMGDVKGRKPIYLIGMILNLGCSVSTFFSYHIFIVYFILFLLGVSVAGRCYVGYTYNLEI